MFDSVDGVDLSKCFTTQPTRGMLYPGEKPQSVTTTFKAEQEITIKDQPMLKCQVCILACCHIMCSSVCTCMHACVRVCVCAYACVCSTCVCMCVLCVYIHCTYVYT